MSHETSDRHHFQTLNTYNSSLTAIQKAKNTGSRARTVLVNLFILPAFQENNYALHNFQPTKSNMIISLTVSNLFDRWHKLLINYTQVVISV